MKLMIVVDNKITQADLPLKIEESTLIPMVLPNGKDIQLTIDAQNNGWILTSNGIADIVDVNNMVIPKIELKEYQSYRIMTTDKIMIDIFSMPKIENETYLLSINDLKTITIGSDKSNNIVYNKAGISARLATIALVDNVWVIEKSENECIYVNDIAIKKKALMLGDIIFINGLKIIWMDIFIKINNPLKLISVSGLVPYNDFTDYDNTKFNALSNEEMSKELYDEKDYFSPLPRIKNKIQKKEVVIDSPPEPHTTGDVPFILSIGSSLTMGVSSIVMVINLFGNGTKSILTTITTLSMCFAMMFGSLLIPMLTKKYNKKQAIKREKLRQEKYSDYSKKKFLEADEIIKEQEQILNNKFPSINECYEMVINRQKNNVNFWSRTKEDDDFLEARLGMGKSKAEIDIKAPEKHFTLDEDNLLETVYTNVKNRHELCNIPITLEFTQKPIIGLFSNCSYTEKFIDGLILQLATLQSPYNLKIVILSSKENESRWKYVKFLPHSWSNDKTTCFFATSQEEINEISTILDNEFKIRKVAIKKTKDSVDEKRNADTEIEEELKNESSYKNFNPYYVIINDNFSKVKNTSIVEDIFSSKDNFGFSMLFTSTTMRNLPSECNQFVELNETNGRKIDKDYDDESQQYNLFSNEYNFNIDMMKVGNVLLNIPVALSEVAGELPKTLEFLEMFNVSKIEQLNILNRWKSNNPISSLATPVGVHTNGEIFKLDLHEKFHGPHGLVAGMTGSGKSEFIITYILSLAINYHPYEVQFVLIDYKGGGLAGAFENTEKGIKLPHLIGTITNLDTSEMNRTLVSIESEMKRRQIVFNKVRNKTGESTIDIYKYQRLYREGIVDEPMAHLFIISDEFAELKSQQPDFMAELISTARIGRSLGVHLILATQKPAGVVNDQIWSNSKFKVCLKVQDRSDSMEMLKRPEAASIKETGRFYLQVGYDDYFDIGQSAWSGAKYTPSDILLKKTDNSIDFVDNIGYIYKNVNDIVKVETKKEMGDQLTNIVKYISNLSVKESLKTNKLWLDKIPEEIFIGNLQTKYNYKPTPYVINPIIGEYDMPSKQEQGLLTMNIMEKGNTIVYGQSGSGKENLLSTIIFSTATSNSPAEINMYIIDLGAETLQMFKKFPHVGDVLGINDENQIIELFNMINDEMENRKNLFTEYGGSFATYNEMNEQKLPVIEIIINAYESFQESFGRLEEGIQGFMRDGAKYGVIFILSTTVANAVRGRMLQYFTNKIVLQMPDVMDYRNILGSPRGLVPAKVFGRGIVMKDDTACEFQSAYIYEKKSIIEIVRKIANDLNQVYTVKAKKIPNVPNIVTIDTLSEVMPTMSAVPIGFNMVSKTPYMLDLLSIRIIPLLSNNIQLDLPFIKVLIQQIKKISDTNVEIIDFAQIVNIPITEAKYINNNYNLELESIQNGKTGNNVYILIGLGNLRNVLDTNGRELLNNIFMKIETNTNSTFIIADNYQGYKQLQLEQWFQVQVNPSYGIWLDEGFDKQNSIRINNLSMDEKQIKYNNMGIVVSNGEHTFIKYAITGDENNE